MATFKIGDKARLVNCENAANRNYRCCTGDEVVILSELGANPDFPISYQITRPAHYGGLADRTFAGRHYLAPLTDPGCERFLESIKRLGREPINDAPKERVTTK